MPRANRAYHWLDAFINVANPETFHQYQSVANLPEGATLWKLLLQETRAGWFRNSGTIADQQLYHVNLNVSYGNSLSSPVVFRTTRSLRHLIAVDPLATIADAPFKGQWWGADQELGFNEELTRGGFTAGPVPVVFTATVYSTGAGTEILAGKLDLPLRVLYSVMPPP